MYPTENYKIMMKESVWVETLGCREFAKISWKETQCPSPIYASLVSNGQRMFIFLPACNLQGIWLPVRARPVLLRIAVIVFMILVAVVLLNLLIAQLNMAYKLAHADMEGYARLTRAGIIVTTVEQVSRKRWRKFLERLDITWLWLEDAQRISKDLLYYAVSSGDFRASATSNLNRCKTFFSERRFSKI